ncbi:hypothetical protein [Endozoicomonas lisbonensis]
MSATPQSLNVAHVNDSSLGALVNILFNDLRRRLASSEQTNHNPSTYPLAELYPDRERQHVVFMDFYNNFGGVEFEVVTCDRFGNHISFNFAELLNHMRVTNNVSLSSQDNFGVPGLNIFNVLIREDVMGSIVNMLQNHSTQNTATIEVPAFLPVGQPPYFDTRTWTSYVAAFGQGEQQGNLIYSEYPRVFERAPEPRRQGLLVRIRHLSADEMQTHRHRGNMTNRLYNALTGGWNTLSSWLFGSGNSNTADTGVDDTTFESNFDGDIASLQKWLTHQIREVKSWGGQLTTLKH